MEIKFDCHTNVLDAIHNDEGKCCCLMSKHTYNIGAEYTITKIQGEINTGPAGKSDRFYIDVQLLVDGIWKTVGEASAVGTADYEPFSIVVNNIKAGVFRFIRRETGYVDGTRGIVTTAEEIMPATVSVTATSAIPLWMWDEDGIGKIPCTRSNPVKVGMSFGIAVSAEGENNKTTIVTPHVDTPEPETIPFNIELSDPLTPVLLRGTYIGNVIVNGGAGTIHVNLTSFIPEHKTVTFNSVPVGANVKID